MAAGAWLATPWPWPGTIVVAIVLIVVGFSVRFAPVVLVGGFILASTLAAHAWASAAPVPASPLHAVVTLRTDPAPFGPGVAAEAITAGRHVELRAFGGAARRLSTGLAGEQLAVDGRVRPPPAGHAARLRARHVVGVVDVDHVVVAGDGTPLARSANRVRHALDRGSRTMTPLDRSLYLGFIVGDDRQQPRVVVDEFRAAGLSHLTAVSGENVAFLLAVAGPVLRRLRSSARWAGTLALIGWFAMLTRFEPSVMRASVMAALATTGVAVGRRAAPVRLLSLAVVVNLLIDPLLVHAVGWWLSVGATAGIAALAEPLAVRLPGPAALRGAMGVTIAAQLGVAPVSVAVFGPLPLASIPANLLAVPAAGPVMIYGLPAGLVASVAPDGVARLIQVPDVILVRWVARVAAVAADLPVPSLGAIGLVVAGLAVAWALHRPPRHRSDDRR